MHPDGNFRFQLVGQCCQHPFFVQCTALSPRVSKPSDDLEESNYRTSLSTSSPLSLSATGRCCPGDGLFEKQLTVRICGSTPSYHFIVCDVATLTLASSSPPTFRKAMYCFTPSIRFWNSTRATFILEIIDPMFPTMVANIRTPARKSATTKRYSASFSGVGVSPIVVRVRVDQ